VSEDRRFFVPIPWDFFGAWLVDQRVKRTHVLSALYVAGRCFEARNTSGGVAPIELSTLARLCGVDSTETIRRWLHDLRDWGWIDFQPGDGGNPAWRIWLTGLSLDEPCPRPRHDLSTEPDPVLWRALSTAAQAKIDASPLPDGDQPSSTSPQSVSGEPPKRYETRPQEKNNRNHIPEEELDHVLGETTARVRVAQVEGGSLAWSGESLEGERGLLEDCQALVDAGIAHWEAT
jgi:hypothetical protein